jgi:hypothetical protein
MKPEYLGARGSNTGDDFHEWWALRSALLLIKPDTELTAIKVEGVNLGNKKDQSLSDWDSVDCSLYYGGHTLETATKVIIEQLKYSASTPNKLWTVSDLINSKSKKTNNSIIKKLGDTFSRILKIRPDLIKSQSLEIKLVSNRPIGSDLQKSIEKKNLTKYENLRVASGLNKTSFKKFVKLFDFSNCGVGSRFEQEEKAINGILSLTHSTDKGFVLDLKDRIHKQMLPEATDSYITKETVLTWMNVSDPLALYPCPAMLKPVDYSVDRNAATVIHTAMVDGSQYICLHGGGGSGKTTVLRQVEQMLPDASAMIIYDCYGAGTYMDSEAYRHRPKDAYLQIINEFSARLRLPLLINQDTSIDFLRAFKLRIESASSILKAQAEDALLVVVIDAADNAIIGAKQCKPEEVSFIHELLKIGNLPSNTRLMVSSRTGRLDSLLMPEKYLPIEITNFSLEETALNVYNQYPDATKDWIEDFHDLSKHNPRVQSYAFDYAESIPSKALDYLRPHGKGLDQIFEARFKEAILKEGNKDTLDIVCSVLVALPSPAPKHHLASVIGISKKRLDDIISDLPGMRVMGDKVGFLDEDIEFFVREKAQTRMPEAYQRVATHFLDLHESDEYAAMYLAGALFSSGQGQKIIEIIEQSDAPIAIKDQIIRREVQRQRLKLAMKVCRSAGKSADAIFTLLIGAEAIKTDEAVDKIMIENPDLAVHFAQDTVGRNILYSSKMYKKHGRFLSHIIAREAHDKDFIAVREKRRIFREWMDRRSENIEKQEAEQVEHRNHIEPWPIELEDIAAVAHAVLDMQGYQSAYHFICSWTPQQIHFEIALILVNRLLTSGKADTVQAFLRSGSVPEPWSSLFSIPLALVGYKINIDTLEKALCHKKLFKFYDLNVKNMPMFEEKASTKYIEMVLTGCEILAANGKDLSPVKPILERLCPHEWRHINNIYAHDSLKNDIGFRAFSLLRRHSDSEVTIESYCIEPSVAEGIDKDEKQKHEQKLAEQRKELKEKLSGLMNVYAVRADILLSNLPLEDAGKKLKATLGSLLSNAWQLSRGHHLDAISDRLSLAVGKLSVVPNIDMNMVLGLAKESYKEWPVLFSVGQRRTITSLIKIPTLRQQLTHDIYERSTEVKTVKTAASEKINILLDLSRILIFVDREEARAVFKIAVEIANDVDVDAMYEVALFSALAINAKDYFKPRDSIHIASQMAAITTEYGTLLDGYEHFPWEDAISAVATLDMPMAISLIGYWEDCDLSPAGSTIPPLMSTGIQTGSINTAQAVSLLTFCDNLDDGFLTTLTSSVNPEDANQLIEEVSRAELLRFNRSGRSKIVQILNKLVPYNTDSRYWHSTLNKLILFRSKNNGKYNAAIKDDDLDSRTNRLKEKEFLASISVVDISFESVPDFIESMRFRQVEARKNKLYISCGDIIESIANHIVPENRINFLKLFTDDRVIDDLSYSWAKTLIYCTDLWSGTSHAISSWKKENLPPLITENLGEFTYNITYSNEKNMLVDILDSLKIEPENIVGLLLGALEKNANALPLSTLYAVLGILVDYCKGTEVADVTTRYIHRLTARLKLAESPVDLGCTVDTAVAHQLYSFLGDIDTRIRWRAAHCIRASVRMGDFQIIVDLTELYDRKDMPGYRENKAPFYWLSARLWLVITLDRVASEVPEAIVPVAHRLLSIATDQDFPHVLIRHFLKSCLLKLLSGEHIDFDTHEVDSLHAINTSTFGPEKRDRQFRRGGFYEGGEHRRFRFDSMDTLRYLYPSAIECFSDVDQETFLDEAEAWIVDRWAKDSGLSEWNNEPRKHQFERANYSLSGHSHGGMPTLERYSYYLEWHAMWCAVGALMKTKALAEPKYDDDDYGTFNDFLRRDGLTQPPHWSSDLRCATPLEHRFHYPPVVDPIKWVAEIDANDFDLELGLAQGENNLVIDSYHDIRTKTYHATIRISSALVAPDTGHALVRALQTSDDSHDYRLPPTGNEFEIDEDEYKLRGWIDEYSSDPRLDKKDTFNHGIRMIEASPSKNVIEVLGLCRSEGYPVSWICKGNGAQAFIYEAWADVRDDFEGKQYIFGEEVNSYGHRLKVLPKVLNHYLNKVGFDLIVEIEITRRAIKDGITNYDQKSEKNARYTRLYLLRGTGEILTTEGCVGTWTSPDS